MNISVIIPNYNHARFLEQRIESVLNQTYQDFEVIILDDCSTDNSVEVINKYKENSHISHIVVNSKNSGSPFKQWHKGFEIAKGEWVWIAESDDSCEPTFLETLVEQIDNTSSFVFCRSKRMNQDGVPIVENWQDELKESFTMDGRQFMDEYLCRRCIVWNASSAIFRREYALQIPPNYMDYKAAGDWLFWICLSWLGRVTFIDTPLNCFRLHDNNTTQKSIHSGLAKEEKIKLYNEILAKGYIGIQRYKEIRWDDIYNLYVYSSLNRSTVYKILQQWNVTYLEYCLLWLKKIYRRLKS